VADFAFAAAYDGLADAIVAADGRGVVVYANPAAERLMGWLKDELIGRPITVLMPARMRPAHSVGFNRYMSTREARIMGRSVRVPAIRRDGEEIDVELTLSPYGRGDLVIASIRDLRERVELERQVLAQQRLAAQNAVLSVFGQAESIAEAAPRILEAIGTHLHWPLGNFWILDDGRLRWLGSWNDPQLDATGFVDRSKVDTFAAGIGLPGRAWQERRAAWVVDVQTDSNFPRAAEAVAKGLHGAFAFPVTTSETTVGVVEFFSRAPQQVDPELLETANTLGAQIGQFTARIQATSDAERAMARTEAAERRARFLAEAGAALAESLDYGRTLRRVAELSVPAIADWCTVAVLDHKGELRRVAVTHRDPDKRDLAARYEGIYLPGQHRGDSLRAAQAGGKAVFVPCVTDADLVAAAQDEGHLELLRGLGCTSCIMVPMLVHGDAVGVLSLMLSDAARRFTEADLALAEELAHRAALAVDNARLYRDAQRKQELTRFLAEATIVLSSSLDYEATFQRLADLVVPRFGDWCAVDVLEGGAIRQIAVAHADPAKIELAREIRQKYPIDPTSPTGVPNVLRTGRTELYEDIPDDLLVRSTKDAEHLRLSRLLGLRSAVVIPLVLGGRILGGLTLVWAESGRHYEPDELPLLEELGRRGAAAVENARLYSDAQRAIRLRDEFLSVASHELRTPLTSLQLQVSAMLRLMNSGRVEQLAPATLATRIKTIDRHVDRMGRLVNNLLDVSRATVGQLELELAEVNVASVIRQVVDRFEGELSAAGCEVTLSLDEGLTGYGDRARLDQILSNLLSNAIKYGKGKPIEVSSASADGSATVSVRDHGMGILEQDQQRIFDRFARAVSSENYGGLGLGLWIVRVLIEAMGGGVRVESKPGEGATFVISLPRRQAGAAVSD
jgi:PAS domain S-box-containing protein